MELDHLAARFLLSLASIGYGFVTLKADFNATHATNPAWTPHARFHVVWQMLSYCGIAIIALGLIWLPGPAAVERLRLAAALGGVVLAAFFVTALARPRFGGALYDNNGYLPFKPPLGAASWRWDVNVAVFSVLSAILLLGWAVI